MRLLYIPLAILPMLAACAGNAPVRTPEITLPETFREEQVSASPVVLEHWWRYFPSAQWPEFTDPQLHYLVEEGLKSSPDARIAAARIEEARALRSSYRRGAWPQGALVGRAASTETKDISGSNPFNVGGESYNLGFDVSWELDFFGRTRAANRAIDADYAATVFNAESARASLAANIADGLFLARGLAQQLSSAQDSARIARDLRDVARTRAERGIAATSDTQRLDAEVAQAEASVQAVAADLNAAERSLLVLIGRGTDPARSLSISPLPQTPPQAPTSVPGEILRRRPDVREAEQRMVLATNLLQVDRLALFPKVTLLPGVGLSRSDSPDFAMGTPSPATTATWTLGVGLSIPVLDRPKLLATARASGFKAEQAVLNYEKVVQTAFGEADSALVLLAADRRRVDLLSAGEAQAKASYDAARQRYDLGLDDLTGLLSAEQAWRAARTAHIGARTQAMRRSVQTFKALGGGWTAEAPSSRDATQ